MTHSTIEIRKRILALTNVGDFTDLVGDLSHLEFVAKEFSKARRIPVLIERTELGIRVTKTLPTERSTAKHNYPQIGDLAPGESVLIDAPPEHHQRVRLAASQRGARTGMVFKCTRIGDAIRVTRMDGVDAQDSPTTTRPTKWDLDRLSTQSSVSFSVAPPEQHKLRLAATYKAKQTGWTIRCRLQDDGTMLVYRTDEGAPKAAHAARATE